jgi:hypothetical protein
MRSDRQTVIHQMTLQLTYSVEFIFGALSKVAGSLLGLFGVALS